jgi:hypothetical protein
MKKRDIIIDKGISGAYYADKFLPDNLLLLQLRGGIFCILKNMDYDKK